MNQDNNFNVNANGTQNNATLFETSEKVVKQRKTKILIIPMIALSVILIVVGIVLGNVVSNNSSNIKIEKLKVALDKYDLLCNSGVVCSMRNVRTYANTKCVFI